MGAGDVDVEAPAGSSTHRLHPVVGLARDVSVIGFDDIVLADLYSPTLSTVRQPMPEMAGAAFDLLRARLEDSGPAKVQSLLFRPELVIRESTAAPS